MESSSELDQILSDLRDAGLDATSFSRAIRDSRMSGVERTESSGSLAVASKEGSDNHPAPMPKITDLGQCMRKDLPQQCARKGLSYQNTVVLASLQYDPQTHRLESREYTTTDNMIWWFAVGFAIVQGAMMGKYIILPAKASMATLRQEAAQDDQASLEHLQALKEALEDKALTEDSLNANVVGKSAAMGDGPRDPEDE